MQEAMYSVMLRIALETYEENRNKKGKMEFTQIWRLTTCSIAYPFHNYFRLERWHKTNYIKWTVITWMVKANWTTFTNPCILEQKQNGPWTVSSSHIYFSLQLTTSSSQAIHIGKGPWTVSRKKKNQKAERGDEEIPPNTLYCI